FERHPDFMRNEVGFITTVTALNAPHLPRIAGFLRDLGVRSWKTEVFDAEGRGAGAAELAVPLEPYVAFLEWAVDECAAGRFEGFRLRTLLELLNVVLSSERPHLCLRFPCGAGREFGVAAADGGFLACDATYHPAFRLGALGDGLAAGLASDNARLLAEREAW